MNRPADLARFSIELPTTQQMGDCDRYAMEHGTPGLELMENAGRAVADAVSERAPAAEAVTVLCGPGNNGGDGFVAARLLAGRGYTVRLGLLGEIAALKGDAAEMARRWNGAIQPLSAQLVGYADVVIDAMFGAGLARDITGKLAGVVEAVNGSGALVVAVDVPSGIDGNSGAVRGTAVEADVTVTFFRAKPGHFLLPGRGYCGALLVQGIGIPDEALHTVEVNTFLNGPHLWGGVYPMPDIHGHKYSRGHAVVVSGGAESTGAARLAARGALRAGAGLVTLAGSKAATAVNAAHVTAVMVQSFAGAKGLASILGDERRNTIVIGPGAGVGKATCELVLAALKSHAACVLDADALTSFGTFAQSLFKAIGRRKAETVLTPHDGEFSRLFAKSGGGGSKLERAREAARISHATVVLKGADTVVACADGRAAINANAPPWLATAGAGDVLAGFVAGLMAQGMASFEAACAGVWLHGECARAFGPGLIAEDLPETLPCVLSNLLGD